MNDTLNTGEEFALDLDRRDPLSGFRDRFDMPADTIYMDGNSLGLMPDDSVKSVNRVLDEWRTMGIGGWLNGKPPWFFFAEELGAKMSRIVGARPEEVVATGTTTVNIHALVSTLYKPGNGRTKIMASAMDFPTDIYALKSQLSLKGYDPGEHLVLVPADENGFIDEESIVSMMSGEISLALLPSVLYRSGQLLDIPGLTEEAHARDIVIGFDCCHSVGAVPHEFKEWDVDFAVWCSYKYLNGGPGSPAFLYLNRRHFQREPALAGWFGCMKERQFDMSLEFEHAKCAGGWQISSTGILGSAAVEGALDLILEAGIGRIREKSVAMTSYLIALVEAMLEGPPYNFTIGSPEDAARRGGHVALRHAGRAQGICEALKRRGIVPDFRPPDIVRIAPVALYNTFHEIWMVVAALRKIIEGKEHEISYPDNNIIP